MMIDGSATNASVPDHDLPGTSVLNKVLRLQVHWGSYSVHAAGSPAQPLYERTADGTSGDALTQMFVSPHHFIKKFTCYKKRCKNV
jgi:hypothetical protein